MGICEFKAHNDTFNWHDEFETLYATAKLEDSDNILLYRVPDQNAPWFDDVFCDKETLRRQILNKMAVDGTGNAGSSDTLRIGIVDRNSTPRITNTKALVWRLKQEFPEAEIDVSLMEGKSFRQQVHCCSNQDVVVGGHGASMTNMVFMPPDGLVVEIFPPVYHKCMFRMLAEKSSLGYGAWYSPATDAHADIDLSTLEGRVRARALDLIPNVEEVTGLIRAKLETSRRFS